MLILTLIIISGCSNKTDSKNEEILKKVLSLENIEYNEIKINNEQIIISIETSSANEYDTQLINWWGTIFGISSMLQGNYEVVIIENTVNKEPYAYISTNIYTIQDFEEDRISDAEFWDETLITSNKPRTKEILEASGLPLQTLKQQETKKTNHAKTILIILIILIIITTTTLLILKIKPNKPRIKTRRYKEKILEKSHETKRKIKKIHREKIKPATHKLKQKINKHTQKFRNKLKQEPRI